MHVSEGYPILGGRREPSSSLCGNIIYIELNAVWIVNCNVYYTTFPSPTLGYGVSMWNSESLLHPPP